MVALKNSLSAVTIRLLTYERQPEIRKMKKNFTFAIKRYLVNRIIDETSAKRLSRHNFSQRLSGEALEVMGIHVPVERITHLDKAIAGTFQFRLETSVTLAVKLRMIRSEQIAISIAGNNSWTSEYVTTRFGLLFRRMPSFCQTMLLFIAVSAQNIVGTVNRIKWLTGVVSFATLSIKVLHSGAVDKVWIAISAFAGLAASLLLALWR